MLPRTIVLSPARPIYRSTEKVPIVTQKNIVIVQGVLDEHPLVLSLSQFSTLDVDFDRPYFTTLERTPVTAPYTQGGLRDGVLVRLDCCFTLPI